MVLVCALTKKILSEGRTFRRLRRIQGIISIYSAHSQDGVWGYIYIYIYIYTYIHKVVVSVVNMFSLATFNLQVRHMNTYIWNKHLQENV